MSASTMKSPVYVLFANHREADIKIPKIFAEKLSNVVSKVLSRSDGKGWSGSGPDAITELEKAIRSLDLPLGTKVVCVFELNLGIGGDESLIEDYKKMLDELFGKGSYILMLTGSGLNGAAWYNPIIQAEANRIKKQDETLGIETGRTCMHMLGLPVKRFTQIIEIFQGSPKFSPVDEKSSASLPAPSPTSASPSPTSASPASKTIDANKHIFSRVKEEKKEEKKEEITLFSMKKKRKLEESSDKVIHRESKRPWTGKS